MFIIDTENLDIEELVVKKLKSDIYSIEMIINTDNGKYLCQFYENRIKTSFGSKKEERIGMSKWAFYPNEFILNMDIITTPIADKDGNILAKITKLT